MNFIKKLSALVAATALFCSVYATAFTAYAEDDDEEYESTKVINVFYTNDVHNAYEQTDTAIGYASLAADIKNTKAAENNDAILVDAGDALQGGIIGALSKGMWPAQIMEKMSYDVAVPGNHEFDFGLERFLEIADSVSYDYVSCNFIDLKTGKTVFMPYKMIEKFNMNIAFIGITTPEAYSMSNPNYFKDENGKDIYSFCGGDNGKELYKRVQQTIDEAKSAGADIVIAVGHTGIDPSSSLWTTGEIIANVTGLDVYIDGHSHSRIVGDKYKDKDGNEVTVTSTGTKFTSYGSLGIQKDDENPSLDGISYFLLTDRDICEEQDAEMLSFINGISDNIKETSEKVVAKSEIDLCMNDPDTGKRLVRQQETNLGDFCADAYRAVMEADIALINGGGLRADITKGDVTVGDLIAAHPFGNLLCTAEISGQTILDLLEMSVEYGGDLSYEAGNFQHVSGITFDVDTTIPSPVVTDENKLFVKIDAKRRINNVMVGGEPIDPEKIYTVASHNYLLKNCGGGFTMLQNCKIVKDETVLDYEALITYVTDYLGGVISEDSGYSDCYGQKRIRLYTEKSAPTCEAEGKITYLRGEGFITKTSPATGHSYGEWITVTEATETEEGLMKRVCSQCGKEELMSLGTVPVITDKPAATDKPQDTEKPDKVSPGASTGDSVSPDTGVPFAMPTAIIAVFSLAAMADVKKSRR